MVVTSEEKANCVVTAGGWPTDSNRHGSAPQALRCLTPKLRLITLITKLYYPD